MLERIYHFYKRLCRPDKIQVAIVRMHGKFMLVMMTENTKLDKIYLANFCATFLKKSLAENLN